MLIDFKEKCEELKKIIIASYDWDGKSDFDTLLKENLSKNKELERFYNDNFK